ncbi:uncharacterized protein LOC125563139 [Nematostella vectensis]|uniref:uncharacterized protein LOC125563139 n=1 Tax=Nematostella vectensis TaxID=45351 RepID=UPI0020774669|nr:uncharacterized protein LOC125563139 [Nematostella vectensis]
MIVMQIYDLSTCQRSVMAAGRPFPSSDVFFIFLLVTVHLSRPIGLNVDKQCQVPHWGSVRTFNVCRARYFQGRVSYYNCSTSPSFNLCELRITRSDNVESNPGFPGHSLSVFYQNARSLKAATWDTEGNEALECKLNRLQDIVYSADYDLVAISETWLNSSILDTEILPNGYDIPQGQGNASVNPLSLPGAVAAVEVKLSSNKLLLVAVCYRAPDDNEFVVPFRSLTGLTGSRKYAEVLIVGDFNFPKIQWVEGSGFVNSDVGIVCEFANILSDAFLYQLVEAPTRKENILDLVLVSDINLVDSVFVEGNNCLPSDNKCIYFDFRCSAKIINSPSRSVYDFKNADFASLRGHLQTNCAAIEWDSHDVNNSLRSWKSAFLDAVDTFVPMRNVKNNQCAPWIDCDLAYAIKKKKTFWKNKVRKSKDPAVFEKFRRMRQRIKNWIRANRKAYFTRIASEVHSNAKPFWSFFKTKSSRSSFPETMLEGNNEVTGDLLKAEAFSNRFKSIFTDHSLCSFPAGTLCISHVLSNIVLSTQEVLQELQALNVNKAMGPDLIPARLLVECADAIAEPVYSLFNLSLASGDIFSEWKDANLTPIYKKGPRALFSNYRGISLLPILS